MFLTKQVTVHQTLVELSTSAIHDALQSYCLEFCFRRLVLKDSYGILRSTTGDLVKRVRIPFLSIRYAGQSTSLPPVNDNDDSSSADRDRAFHIYPFDIQSLSYNSSSKVLVIQLVPVPNSESIEIENMENWGACSKFEGHLTPGAESLGKGNDDNPESISHSDPMANRDQVVADPSDFATEDGFEEAKGFEAENVDTTTGSSEKRMQSNDMSSSSVCPNVSPPNLSEGFIVPSFFDGSRILYIKMLDKGIESIDLNGFSTNEDSGGRSLNDKLDNEANGVLSSDRGTSKPNNSSSNLGICGKSDILRDNTTIPNSIHDTSESNRSRNNGNDPMKNPSSDSSHRSASFASVASSLVCDSDSFISHIFKAFERWKLFAELMKPDDPPSGVGLQLEVDRQEQSSFSEVASKINESSASELSSTIPPTSNISCNTLFSENDSIHKGSTIMRKCLSDGTDIISLHFVHRTDSSMPLYRVLPKRRYPILPDLYLRYIEDQVFLQSSNFSSSSLNLPVSTRKYMVSQSTVTFPLSPYYEFVIDEFFGCFQADVVSSSTPGTSTVSSITSNTGKPTNRSAPSHSITKYHIGRSSTNELSLSTVSLNVDNDVFSSSGVVPGSPHASLGSFSDPSSPLESVNGNISKLSFPALSPAERLAFEAAEAEYARSLRELTSLTPSSSKLKNSPLGEGRLPPTTRTMTVTSQSSQGSVGCRSYQSGTSNQSYASPTNRSYSEKADYVHSRGIHSRSFSTSSPKSSNPYPNASPSSLHSSPLPPLPRSRVSSNSAQPNPPLPTSPAPPLPPPPIGSRSSSSSFSLPYPYQSPGGASTSSTPTTTPSLKPSKITCGLSVAADGSMTITLPPGVDSSAITAVQVPGRPIALSMVREGSREFYGASDVDCDHPVMEDFAPESSSKPVSGGSSAAGGSVIQIHTHHSGIVNRSRRSTVDSTFVIDSEPTMVSPAKPPLPHTPTTPSNVIKLTQAQDSNGKATTTAGPSMIGSIGQGEFMMMPMPIPMPMPMHMPMPMPMPVAMPMPMPMNMNMGMSMGMPMAMPMPIPMPMTMPVPMNMMSNTSDTSSASPSGFAYPMGYGYYQTNPSVYFAPDGTLMYVDTEQGQNE